MSHRSVLLITYLLLITYYLLLITHYLSLLPTPYSLFPYSLLHADTRMSFVTPYSLLPTTCGHTNVLCYFLLHADTRMSFVTPYLPTAYSLSPHLYRSVSGFQINYFSR